MLANKVDTLEIDSVCTKASGVLTLNNVEKVMSATRVVDFLLPLGALYIRKTRT